MRDYPSTLKDHDQLDLLLATTHIGLVELEIKTGQALRNLRHDNIFGYPELLDEWSFQHFLDHILEYDRDRVAHHLQEVLDTGSGWNMETQIKTASGEIRWISTSGVPKLDDDGTVLKVLGHVIDITETKESEERHRLLARELGHRVKNTLGVVRSIARLTFGKNDEKTEDFSERLAALADIHDLLQTSDWRNVDLSQIVDSAVKMAPDNRVQVTPSDKPAHLSPNAAVTFSMAIHELCTNSIKYGSLQSSAGAVYVDWNISDTSKEFVFTWKERNGPPPAQERTPGFGETILKSALASEIDGVVDMDFTPAGLIVTARGQLTAQLQT